MVGDFLGPLAYSDWFPWAALGLLVLVAAWFAYVILSTRRRRPVPRAAPMPPATSVAPDLARLRRDYLQRIDAVAGEAVAGTRSGRSCHQELSLLVRSFIRDASGLDATRMTLAELRAVSQTGNQTQVSQARISQAQVSQALGNHPAPGLPAAADAIAAMYPAAFGAAPASGVPAAAETAREVVRSWN